MDKPHSYRMLAGVMAIALLASACGDSSAATTTTDPSTSQTTEAALSTDAEPDGRLEAVHFSPASKIDPTPVAAFDQPALNTLRNAVNYQAGNFGRDATTADIPGLQDIDWETEFVLLAVIDACGPESITLDLAEADATLNYLEEGEGITCEALTPYGAFFVIPRSIDVEDKRVSFSEVALPSVNGTPVEVLLPIERGGVRPIGVFPAEELGRDQRPENDTAFVFDNTDRLYDVLDGMSLLDSNDGVPQRVEAQLAAVDVENEFVLVVAHDVCAPIGFELVASETGFTQVLSREDIECAWAPPVVLVYVASRNGPDGVTYSPDTLPEITYDLAE